MGNVNAVQGSRPNTKSPNMNKCSTVMWDGDLGSITDAQKGDLKSNDAYILVKEFCDIATRGNDELNPANDYQNVRNAYDASSEGVTRVGDRRGDYVIARDPNGKVLTCKPQIVTDEDQDAVCVSKSGNINAICDWRPKAGTVCLIPTGTADTLDGAMRRDTQMCTSIGDPVEWAPYDQGADTDNAKAFGWDCSFNSINPGYSVNGFDGCNAAACATRGFTQSCARVGFRGDPVVCCFNDYACDNEEDKCFQTPERQRTCPLEYRNLASSTCRGVIEDYCTGDALFPSQSSWLEMWLDDAEVEINSGMAASDDKYRATFYSNEVDVSERGKRYPLGEKQPCLRAIARNVTQQTVCTWDDLQGGTVITGVYDPEGLEWGREIIKKVVEKFTDENEEGLLQGINRPGGNGNQNSFYNTLWSLCNKIPLLCTNGNEVNPEGILHNLCSNVTPENISDSPNLIRWCSCYMNESYYTRYQDNFNISKECTPMCNREGVIPSINSDGERNVCIQNLCMLNDVNINITSAQFGENSSINFSQLCSSCGKGVITRRYDSRSYKRRDKGIYYMLKDIPELVTGESDQDSALLFASTYGQAYNLERGTTGFTTARCLYTTVKFLNDNGLLPSSANTPIPNGGISNRFLSEEKGKNLPRMDVQFGSTNFNRGGNPTGNPHLGVVNVTIDIDEDNLPQGFNAGDKFVILFKDEVVNGNYETFSLTDTDDPGNNDTSPRYAGDPMGDPNGGDMQLVRSTDSVGEISYDIEDELKWAGFEGSVSADTCNCTMEGTTLNILNSKFGGNINFTQECGKSTCYDDQGRQISCASSGDDPLILQSLSYIEKATAELETKEKYSTTFNILIVVGIFLFLIYYIYILINK
jgi:hypothetical protein